MALGGEFSQGLAHIGLLQSSKENLSILLWESIGSMIGRFMLGTNLSDRSTRHLNWQQSSTQIFRLGLCRSDKLEERGSLSWQENFQDLSSLLQLSPAT